MLMNLKQTQNKNELGWKINCNIYIKDIANLMCEFFYQERKDHSLTSRQEPPVNYGRYKVFVLTMNLFFLVYSRSSWKFRKYHDSLPTVSIILYYLFEIFFVLFFLLWYSNFYLIICQLINVTLLYKVL